jgi:flagellar hook assembly protein FlgD
LSAGSGNVDLAVFDAVGRRVANLAAGAFPAGDWSMTWDGRDEATGEPAPSGTYFLRLETGTGNITEKITLVR